MIQPNDPPATPEWSWPRGCMCDCRCATPTNWQNDQRRNCGCCPASCTVCWHGPIMPNRWPGDDN